MVEMAAAEGVAISAMMTVNFEESRNPKIILLHGRSTTENKSEIENATHQIHFFGISQGACGDLILYSVSVVDCNDFLRREIYDEYFEIQFEGPIGTKPIIG